VAVAAQQFGLAWGQATVSAIEAGRRGVSVGELALLPSILERAGITTTRLTISELIPGDPTTSASLAPGATLPLATIRALFGQGSTVLMPLSGALTLTGHGAITEVDRRVARALKVSPEAVAQAALRAWGRPLHSERDARVNDLAASAQKRGRVTRQLLRELKPTIRRRK